MTTLSGLIAEREEIEPLIEPEVSSEAPIQTLADIASEQETDHQQHERRLLAQRDKELAEQGQRNQKERQKVSEQELKVALYGDYFDPHRTLDSADAASLFDLDILMGTWMGFHDGDKPLMAKLAAHDQKRDTYIFVDREGIKMRELKKFELVSLMDTGLVDILETRSNFRDEIARLRKEREK
jgi:hypothetical protein